MQSASVKQIRDELSHKSEKELTDLCLRLARFKKENKELLTYLLFEANDEAEYIRMIKVEMTEELRSVNTTSYYLMKKTVRKVLRNTKKHIRYSGKPATEIELLLFFCKKIAELKPSIRHSKVLWNLYLRQLTTIEKRLSSVHEDYQYDFKRELAEIPR